MRDPKRKVPGSSLERGGNMKREVHVKGLAAVVIGSFIGLISLPVLAENYLPNFERSKECKSYGPVEVCAINKGLSYQRMEVTYRGPLANANQLEAYIKLNGNDGMFQFNKTAGGWQAVIGKSHSYLCRVVEDDLTADAQQEKAGAYPICRFTRFSLVEHPNKAIVYETEAPPPAELKLFINTYDSRGFPKVWEVEVAVSAKDGRWDSLDGANYRFQIE